MARPHLQPSDRADVFRAVAHRWRRVILDRLTAQPMAVGELARLLPISDATLSAHLGILRDAGLVRSQRLGASLVYQADRRRLGTIRRWLDASPSTRPHRRA